MKTPPMLLGLTLLFWGWQTGLLFFAVILAAVLEGSRLVRARWDFSQADLNRIWNLCVILFLGAVIVAFAANEGATGVTGLFETGSMAKRSDALNKTARSMMVFLQWMPLIFFPIAAAQAFHARDTMDFGTFSWLVRQRQAKQGAPAGATRAGAGVNVSVTYFALCLLASSAVNQRARWSYFGLALLMAWSLWGARNKRFSWAAWGSLLAVVVALGYAGHLGLYQLQKILENVDATFLSNWFKQDIDPKESRTSIGSIGKLKLSGRIVLRLETEDGQPPPSLLREASYDSFKSPSWFASRKDFTTLIAENDGTTWQLLPQKNSRQSVGIARYLPRGIGLLALPNGTSELRDLPVFTLKSNQLGVVRVEGGPGLVRYLARYGTGATIDSPPDPGDTTNIPPTEAAAVSQIASELKLSTKTTNQILRTVAAFFEDNFQYSTYLDIRSQSASRPAPLAAFLLRRRAGHCEYFATATVLLLRQAGVPARYAVGYSVQEGSAGKYLVRERHAHAWCLAYVNGAWRDFDTTPPLWQEVESKNASFWEPLSDAWARLWFEFSKWRWSRGGSRKYLTWIVLALLVLLIVRLFWKKQWSRFRHPHPEKRAVRLPPGLDSEFYLIEKELTHLGLERRPGETLSAWLNRIGPFYSAAAPLLQRILTLHYRLRFDPAGLNAAERQSLKSEVEAWLKQQASATPDPAGARP